MKIEIAQPNRMAESGSSLLKLIQNQDMPLLDLLVREAVQNSLDASNGTPFVNVDFSIKSFVASNLNRQLEGITERLDKRFPNRDYDCIIISDSNTVGLTGPVKYDDVVGNEYGNCLKLIYEICKPQMTPGAGGSWGLGKTIYFRVGIGLVLYYSRMKDGNRYRSRLAACLVEDETKKHTLIPVISRKGVKRGIAWWGVASSWHDKTTVPIEDEKEIRKVLDVFGITPYQDAATGTTIIIPYVDQEKLLREVYAINDDQNKKPYWANSIDEYLIVALQRWYAPRILNSSYQGPYLRPSVNISRRIKVNNMLPLFRVVRELYILATTGHSVEDPFIQDNTQEVQVEPIRTRELFEQGDSSAGRFVHVKLTDEQLEMLPPYNKKSPYQQITNRDMEHDKGNNPIIMFTRKPGMIVGYDYNGPWTHNSSISPSNEYIIGLFVANSPNKMLGIVDASNKPLSLEEYLRQGEKADHATWTDRNINGANPRVVEKVQGSINRIIKAKYKEKSFEIVDRKNIGLSHALANILLPSVGFGSKGNRTVSPGPNPNPNPAGTNKPRIVLSSPQFVNGSIVFSFEAFVCDGTTLMELSIATEYKRYNAETWEDEDEIGKKFPIRFERLLIQKRKEPGKRKEWEAFYMDLTEENVEEDSLKASFRCSSSFGSRSQIRIDSHEKAWIGGKLSIASDDPSLRFSVDAKEETV